MQLEEDIFASYHGCLNEAELEEILFDKLEGWFTISQNPRRVDSKVFVVSVVLEEKQISSTKSPAKNTARKVYSDTAYVVQHKLIRLNVYSKVEGYYFLSFPHRVYPSLVHAIQSDSSLKRPLRCELEGTQSLEEVLQAHDHYSTLNILSDELVVKILSLLTPPELCRYSMVSKHWYALTKDEYLWHNWYVKCFGERVPPIHANERGDLDWKLQFWFEHSVQCTNKEPYVFSPSESELMQRLANSNTNTICILSAVKQKQPQTLGARRQLPSKQIETKTLNLYRVKTAHKVGYALNEEGDNLGQVYPSLQKLLTALRLNGTLQSSTQYLQPPHVNRNDRARPWETLKK